MSLRNEIEHVLRAWNRYETERGAPPVVDFDCDPGGEVAEATSRLAVRDRLTELESAARSTPSSRHLADRLTASIAYLDELLGARTEIRPYIERTQGCPAAGWTDSYIEGVRAVAIDHLSRLGVPWGAHTMSELAGTEQQIDVADAPDVIRKYASECEADVRRLTASDAPFNLSIEHVEVDEYWAYWLDGAGYNVRMRINSRNAIFTDVQALQFALHEILGHGLQCASFSQECERREVPWVRLTAVHAQQQVLLEGLAQALPLFVRPDDQKLVARVRLTHFLELVRAKLHLALNDGASILDCVAIARKLAPFWRPERIGDALSDRGVNPLLRSYLWSYPAGIDWFVNLADSAPKETVHTVLTTSYREPLTPGQLASLWPEGPSIGGDAAC